MARPRGYRLGQGVNLKEVVVMGFIQLIEFTTSRPDEVETLVDEWLTQTAGRRTAQRGTFTQEESDRTPTCRSWSFPRTRMQWPTRTSPRRQHSPNA